MATNSNRNSAVSTPEITQQCRHPRVAVRLTKSAAITPNMPVRSELATSSQPILARPRDFSPSFFSPTQAGVQSIVIPTCQIRVERDGYVSQSVLRKRRHHSPGNPFASLAAMSKRIFFANEFPAQRARIYNSIPATAQSRERSVYTASGMTSTKEFSASALPTNNSIPTCQFLAEFPNIDSEELHKAMRVKLHSAERMKINRNISLLRLQPSPNTARSSSTEKEKCEYLKRILKPRSASKTAGPRSRQIENKWYNIRKQTMSSGYYQHNYTHNLNCLLAKVSGAKYTTVSALISHTKNSSRQRRSAEKLVAQARFCASIAL